MRRLTAGPTYANVVSTMCLFIALGARPTQQRECPHCQGRHRFERRPAVSLITIQRVKVAPPCRVRIAVRLIVCTDAALPTISGVKVPPFDCGKNTSFSAQPGVGGWLSNHWNIARSYNRFVVGGSGS